MISQSRIPHKGPRFFLGEVDCVLAARAPRDSPADACAVSCHLALAVRLIRIALVPVVSFTPMACPNADSRQGENAQSVGLVSWTSGKLPVATCRSGAGRGLLLWSDYHLLWGESPTPAVVAVTSAMHVRLAEVGVLRRQVEVGSPLVSVRAAEKELLHRGHAPPQSADLHLSCVKRG